MNLYSFIFGSHLDDEEEIIDVAHRHLIIYIRDSFKTLFFGIVLPILFFFIFPEYPLIPLLWGGIGLIGMLYHFIDWFFDAWLITNTGVIDIERNGLFDRSSTRIEYHMIEGMSYNIRGVWQTIFNYGEITLDKLGANTTVLLKDGTNPKKIERKIMRYQEQFVKERSIRDHHALKDMLSEMIAYHVQNNKIKIPKNHRK